MAEHDLAAAVSAAAEQLAAAGVASPRVDAEELAAALLGMARGRLQAVMIRGAAVPDGYHDLVARRAQREPLQHLTGVTGFRHVDIACAAGVFVARPETELVAGAAIEAARRSPHPLVVDLCTGSGAIAAAVLDEVPTARVVAVDLHAAACALAETNLRRVAPADRFTVVHADATAEATLADLDGTVDVCVSNPPYVPDGTQIAAEAGHDPPAAVFGGPTGCELPMAVARRAARLLRPSGVFVVEHHDDRQPALIAALQATGWQQVRGHRDLAERHRFITAVPSSRV